MSNEQEGEGAPSPVFLDLLILKSFKSNDFGSAHSKGVAGANLGSAHSKGVSGFERLFTEYYTIMVNWCQGKNGAGYAIADGWAKTSFEGKLTHIS